MTGRIMLKYRRRVSPGRIGPSLQNKKAKEFGFYREKTLTTARFGPVAHANLSRYRIPGSGVTTQFIMRQYRRGHQFFVAKSRPQETELQFVYPNHRLATSDCHYRHQSMYVNHVLRKLRFKRRRLLKKQQNRS